MIVTFPKASDVGEALMVGRTVVPVRVTVPVTAGAATLTRINADRLRVLLGVKVTLIVQDPPTARPVPPIGQFWVIPKRPGLLPARLMPVMRRAALPVLETVTVCATVVTPRGEVNANAVGFSVSTGPTGVTVNVPGT